MQLVKITDTTKKLQIALNDASIEGASKTSYRNVTPIAKSVKITSKHKQNAQNKREQVENTFMRIASVERKKDKKANFFNKHK